MDHARPVTDVLHSGGPQATSGRENKRRKVTLACAACRERKVRCDGEKPVCGGCRRRKPELWQGCIYEPARQGTHTELPRSDESFRELLGRIQHLEQKLANSTSTHAEGRAQSSIQDSECLGHVSRESRYSLPDTGQQINESSRMAHPRRSTGDINFSQSKARSVGIPHLDSIQSATGIRSLNNGAHDGGQTAGSSAQPAASAGRDFGTIRSLLNHSSIDAMGSISIIDENSPEKSGNSYYGHSSTISFMEDSRSAVQFQTREAAEAPSGSASNHVDSNGSKLRQARRDSVDLLLQIEYPQARFEDFVLPPRYEGDHLIRSYWDHVASLYPFLHRPTFESAYDQLWSSGNTDENLSKTVDAGLGNVVDAGPTSRLFHCALNAMFALGCQFSSIPKTQRRKTSNSFFRRALELLQVDLMDKGCMSLVQTLLLMGQYLQSTAFPNRCWNLIGMACRVSQGLGLHVEYRKSKRVSLGLEMRRRVWYGCVTLDIVLSMTLGRPTMINNDLSVSLPAPVDDEYLQDSHCTSQPPQIFSRTVFFLETIKLYNLLGEILSKIYNQSMHSLRSGSSTPYHSVPESARDPIDFGGILQLEKSMAEFYMQLPTELKWSSSDSGAEGVGHRVSPTIEKQKNVLHARYLHLRILLYRPTFTGLFRALTSTVANVNKRSTQDFVASEDSGFHMVFQERSGASCVRAAKELIALIHRSSKTQATGAWWYNVFYTYTAGVVIIMALLYQPLEDTRSILSLEQSWKQSQDTLKSIMPLGPSAEQCLDSLEALKSRIGSLKILRNPNHAEPEPSTVALDSTLPKPHEARVRHTQVAFASRLDPNDDPQSRPDDFGYRDMLANEDMEASLFFDIDDIWTGATFDLFAA